MRSVALLLVLLGSSAVWAQPFPVPTRPSTPPVVPPGFEVETVLSGLRAPTAFTFAPDGRIFVLERGTAVGETGNVGAVRVAKGGALLEQPALTLSVCGEGERGLMGIALDPHFAENGSLYLYYTRPTSTGAPCGFNEPLTGPQNRVSRFTMKGDVIDPKSERILIDTIHSTTSIHNAGDLRFDNAGHLFVTTGDNDLPNSPAPDTSSLLGKILRIQPLDGSAGGYRVPTDNPFAGAPNARDCGTELGNKGGPCREIWAYGLRNPFRITYDAESNALYAFDVGVNAFEEIDLIEPGRNYGYPKREAWCPRGVICASHDKPIEGLTDPIWGYPHIDGGSPRDACVIGGPVYRGTAYPQEYRGSLFFGDWVRGWIRRLTREGDAWKEHEFASKLGGVIGMAAGTDGNVYFLDYGEETGNLLRRFVYRP